MKVGMGMKGELKVLLHCLSEKSDILGTFSTNRPKKGDADLRDKSFFLIFVLSIIGVSLKWNMMRSLCLKKPTQFGRPLD